MTFIEFSSEIFCIIIAILTRLAAIFSYLLFNFTDDNLEGTENNGSYDFGEPFIDNNGNKWLFTNKSIDKFDDHNSELYIYKVQDNNFENIEPHKFNPVITDCKTARNAGKIFYNHKGYLNHKIFLIFIIMH